MKNKRPTTWRYPLMILVQLSALFFAGLVFGAIPPNLIAIHKTIEDGLAADPDYLKQPSNCSFDYQVLNYLPDNTCANMGGSCFNAMVLHSKDDPNIDLPNHIPECLRALPDIVFESLRSNDSAIVDAMTFSSAKYSSFPNFSNLNPEVLPFVNFDLIKSSFFEDADNAEFLSSLSVSAIKSHAFLSMRIFKTLNANTAPTHWNSEEKCRELIANLNLISDQGLGKMTSKCFFEIRTIVKENMSAEKANQLNPEIFEKMTISVARELSIYVWKNLNADRIAKLPKRVGEDKNHLCVIFWPFLEQSEKQKYESVCGSILDIVNIHEI